MAFAPGYYFPPFAEFVPSSVLAGAGRRDQLQPGCCGGGNRPARTEEGRLKSSKPRRIINVRDQILWCCKWAKAPQRFAKEHQQLISLISFTYGKPFPGSQGLPVPGEGTAPCESEGCSALTVQKSPACAFWSSQTPHNPPAVPSLSACRSVR